MQSGSLTGCECLPTKISRQLPRRHSARSEDGQVILISGGRRRIAAIRHKRVSDAVSDDVRMGIASARMVPPP